MNVQRIAQRSNNPRTRKSLCPKPYGLGHPPQAWNGAVDRDPDCLLATRLSSLPGSFAPVFSENIGSIHFARWVTVPGTRDFLFFSNYAVVGKLSWDFITRAHFG